MCYAEGVAQTVCPLVSAVDRARLAAIAADRNRPQKHAARARIILHSAARLDVAEVARRAGIGRPAVWRWQQRFAEAGVDGLLRDKTRKPGKPCTPEAVVQRVVAPTCEEPPGGATHWTGRAMAEATGLSLRTVQRIWAAHQLQPHRLRTFKRSRDPEFLAKLEDIVGLHIAPPRHAVVLSVDEKSRIQALDRTQPGLPLEPGKAATMTHDYIRPVSFADIPPGDRAAPDGTTTLFAALNVLDGTVIGRCMQRHRHQEFVRFLNAVEAAVPAGKLIHAILDNYATHRHAKVRAWLARHPRWTFHYTPTSGSWLNAVETFFSAMTRRRLRRGVFRSLVDLQAAINRYLAEHNANPKPFTWTATPVGIIAKLNTLNAPVQ
jgi:transposase